MKKLLLAVAGLFVMGSMFAQLQDEQNVTITMDLQPVLQLSMETPDQIDFVFDGVDDYIGGIVKYGATILKVSSTVNWNLYAVGTSTSGTAWDQHIVYGEGTGEDDIPLSALELHQNVANVMTTAGFNGAVVAGREDYSTDFTSFQDLLPANIGQNSIYHSATPYGAPGVIEKYIQGHKDAADFSAGGSYLLQATTAMTSVFYNVIDYRIVPGLPVVFPFAGTNAAGFEGFDDFASEFAQPGVYTMNVKYVLMENQ